MQMQLGMIGLGRMGGNIVRRLMKDGHTAVVYDSDPKAVDGARRQKAPPAPARWKISSAKLDKPRAAWVMLPAGKITETTSRRSASCCSPATSSSTAATPSGRTTSAAPRRSKAKGIALSSTSAPAAASGASNAAIA